LDCELNVLNVEEKKFRFIFKELSNFLVKKFSLSYQIWPWDPGSEIRIRKKPISDPGVKKVLDPGS
jgi:hypothetical protein